MGIAEYLAAQPGIVLFFILCVFLALGDVLSEKTRAFLPSVFVFSLLILVCAWTGILPSNTFEVTGIVAPFTGIVSLLTVSNMGSSMNVNDLKRNWRAALIGFGGVIGTAMTILTIGTMFFGWETAVVSSPVVAGGIVASLEMQAAARESGNEGIAIVAALILAFQSFFGFIITPILLKKCMKKDIARGNFELGAEFAPPPAVKTFIPVKYHTNAMLLACTAMIGTLAVYASKFTKTFMGTYNISQSIFALLFGILFAAVGIVPAKLLNKASSNGIILILTIFSAFGVLTKTTFAEVAAVAAPVLGNIVIGIVGIFILCAIIGKLLKVEWELAVAIGLNCLLGFPLNYQLTIESIGAVTKDEEQAKYLEAKYMPQMLVGGFVTVTIGSVIMAGILRNFL